MQIRSPGWDDPLEKGMATHFSMLAWKIPWTEEPGGLQSMGPQGQRRLKQHSTHKLFYAEDFPSAAKLPSSPDFIASQNR